MRRSTGTALVFRSYCSRSTRRFPSAAITDNLRYVCLVDESARGDRKLLSLDQTSRHQRLISEVKKVGFGGYVNNGKDFVSLPRYEDVASLMPRGTGGGTTITYPKEAMMLAMVCDVKPDDVILEAGTGCGALTILLSRLVGPHGKVISFESRQEAAHKALQNLQTALPPKLVNNVELRCESLDSKTHLPAEQFDAVVLDMAQAWHCFPAVVPAMKMATLMGIYVPNLTQVWQCITTINKLQLPLRVHGCQEIMLRSWEVRPPVCRPLNHHSDKNAQHNAFLLFFQRTQEHAPQHTKKLQKLEEKLDFSELDDQQPDEEK